MGSAERAKDLGTPLHTHASENADEIAIVRERTGLGNIEYLSNIGVFSGATALAHCVHLENGDIPILRSNDVTVVHCPSSNLKLASGVAKIPELLESGVRVALGADGAPCNNNLDMLMEMRLAALIHKPRRGPKSMTAHDVFEMATRKGAQALGLQNQIGSLEPGKKADITLFNLDKIHTTGGTNPVEKIVYSARADDVETVLIDGVFVKKDGELTNQDSEEIRARALDSINKLHRSIL